MRRLLIVLGLTAGLSACAPEVIMSSKDQAVIDAATPGSAVVEAQRECSRHDRKPYFLRSNRRTYWFLCLPKDANTAGSSSILGMLRDRDRDRERERERKERRREPPPPPPQPQPQAQAPLPPVAQPRVAPGMAMGQVPMMPQVPGMVMVPQGYVASNQPMYVPNMGGMAPPMPGMMIAPQPQIMAANPPVIGSVVPPSAPPVVEGNPDGRYWIQLGASPNRQQAAQLGQSVLGSNADFLGNRQVLLQPTQVPGRGTYYRTHLGPFANRGEAAAACGALRQRNHSCFPTTR